LINGLKKESKLSQTFLHLWIIHFLSGLAYLQSTELYEEIAGQDIKFKGFVDAMIKAKNKRGLWCLWILDWKTSGPRGWSSDKRRDVLVQSQPVLYKNFCSQKFEIDPKDIKCGFVVLKRGLKPNKACELIEVSAGPKTLEKIRQACFIYDKRRKGRKIYEK